MSFFAGIGFSAMSCPPTEIRPSFGGMNPVIMRIEVDLPAPFGPRKPSTSPRSTENEMPFTARLVPNILTKFSTLIMALLHFVPPDYSGHISFAYGSRAQRGQL